MIFSNIKSVARLTTSLKYRFAPKPDKQAPAPPAPAPAVEQVQPVKQQPAIRILNNKEIKEMKALGDKLRPQQKQRVQYLSKCIHSLKLPTFLHFLVRNYNYNGLKVIGQTEVSPQELKVSFQSLQLSVKNPNKVKAPPAAQKPQAGKAQGKKK